MNNNQIIPVIGDQAFYYQDHPGGKRISLSLFLAQALSELETPQKPIDFDLIQKGYYGLTKLRGYFSPDFNFEGCYIEVIKEAIAKDQIVLDPDISHFLRCFCPRIIITTLPFTVLEKIAEFFSYQTDYFKYGDPSHNRFILSESNHLIYHIFGIAADGQLWAWNESNLLRIMHSLHDKSSRPSGLSDYLAKRSLLFLGCDFSNWLFRFLWYSLNMPIGDKDEPAFRRNKSGFWLNEKATEDNAGFDELSTFLRELDYMSTAEISPVLNAAANGIQPYENMPRHNKKYDIFISYSHEDRLFCETVVSYLRNKHNLRVWVDYEQCMGYFPTEIQKGLEESAFYMPLLTESFLKKTTGNQQEIQPKEPIDLKTEVALARKHCIDSYRNNTYSIPVIRDGDCYNRQAIDYKLIETFSDISSVNRQLPSELFFRQTLHIWKDNSIADFIGEYFKGQ